MILALAAFVQLAATCAPSVHVDTLASVAKTESQFDPLAIHDNVTGQTFHPASIGEAVRIATDLVTTRRHSTDLGLMQVNSANLPALGLALPDAFDDCRNIVAGARILAENYRSPPAGDDAQPAIRQALSRYNTGHADRGFTNGYVRRVQLAANQIVPAIHADTLPDTDRADPKRGPASLPAMPAPPAWDVYGQARAQRGPGTLVLNANPQAPSDEKTAQKKRPDATSESVVTLQAITDRTP